MKMTAKLNEMCQSNIIPALGNFAFISEHLMNDDDDVKGTPKYLREEFSFLDSLNGHLCK